MTAKPAGEWAALNVLQAHYGNLSLEAKREDLHKREQPVPVVSFQCPLLWKLNTVLAAKGKCFEGPQPAKTARFGAERQVIHNCHTVIMFCLFLSHYWSSDAFNHLYVLMKILSRILLSKILFIYNVIVWFSDIPIEHFLLYFIYKLNLGMSHPLPSLPSKNPIPDSPPIFLISPDSPKTER